MAQQEISKTEFSGVRSQFYKEIMLEMPEARLEEREMLMKYLNPKSGEKILEIGAGTGFYSQYISRQIFPGIFVATDPSAEQLSDIPIGSEQNVEIVVSGADTIPIGEDPLEPTSFDAAWAFGCFHHIFNKTRSFQNMHALLKPGGRVVISDVYAGTKLAQHFDLIVSKYCVTGHEVAFLTKEYADSLCYLNGFEKPIFYDIQIPINFKKKEDIGYFIYKIHAMTKINPEKCLRYVTDYLEICHRDGVYSLMWPHTVLCTRKGIYEQD